MADHPGSLGSGPRLSRRRLLAAAGASGVGLVLAGCNDEGKAGQALTGDIEASQIPFVPPSMPPESSAPRFLTEGEFSMLDALMSRILPGTSDDPGAHEAGAVNFVDNTLAEFETFDEPTFFEGPFVGVDDDADKLPPGAADLTDDALDRYGFQGAQTPQEFYRAGLASLDAYAMSSFGVSFAAATGDQQDHIVAELATGNASGFDSPSAKSFFKRVRKDTIRAVFSDPLYGGNRNFAGWRLIGYPGAQRGWTPSELIDGPNPSRTIKGLQHLHPTNPGRPSPPAVEPTMMPDPRVH